MTSGRASESGTRVTLAQSELGPVATAAKEVMVIGWPLACVAVKGKRIEPLHGAGPWFVNAAEIGFLGPQDASKKIDKSSRPKIFEG